MIKTPRTPEEKTLMKEYDRVTQDCLKLIDEAYVLFRAGGNEVGEYVQVQWYENLIFQALKATPFTVEEALGAIKLIRGYQAEAHKREIRAASRG